MLNKYLFSLTVEPYEPNKQFSIISANGGRPRYHFPIESRIGMLIAMIDFENVNELQEKYDWIKEGNRGYY